MRAASTTRCLACCLLPFFVALRFISDRLRKTLLDAVIAGRDLALLAGRFDTALNNMPSGLCMFDAEHRVAVVNNRLIELFDLPAMDRKGETARDLVRDCVAAGTILRSESDRFATNLERRLAGADKSGFTIQKQDGRTLSLTFQPMENGGSVALVEDITERREAEARIRHLARYDSLTGLPNRMHLRERMEATLAAAGSKPSAILFVDLDQFKQVNDTLGHPRGDLLLSAVADRLKRLVRESDIVARFGGDEFVVVQTPTSGPEEAATLARRIVAALSETYEIDGHQVVIGASIGIAMAPRDATGADHLLKNADMALVLVKGGAARHLAVLRVGNGRARAGAARPRTRPAQRARQRLLRGLLPAALRPEDDEDHHLRGAAALAASAARHDLAGRVHPGRGGDGTDCRDRQLGAATRRAGPARRGRAMCASRSTCRPTSSAAAT